MTETLLVAVPGLFLFAAAVGWHSVKKRADFLRQARGAAWVSAGVLAYTAAVAAWLGFSRKLALVALGTMAPIMALASIVGLAGLAAGVVLRDRRRWRDVLG